MWHFSWFSTYQFFFSELSSYNSPLCLIKYLFGLWDHWRGSLWNWGRPRAGSLACHRIQQTQQDWAGAVPVSGGGGCFDNAASDNILYWPQWNSGKCKSDWGSIEAESSSEIYNHLGQNGPAMLWSIKYHARRSWYHSPWPWVTWWHAFSALSLVAKVTCEGICSPELGWWDVTIE